MIKKLSGAFFLISLTISCRTTSPQTKPLAAQQSFEALGRAFFLGQEIAQNQFRCMGENSSGELKWELCHLNSDAIDAISSVGEQPNLLWYRIKTPIQMYDMRQGSPFYLALKKSDKYKFLSYDGNALSMVDEENVTRASVFKEYSVHNMNFKKSEEGYTYVSDAQYLEVTLPLHKTGWNPYADYVVIGLFDNHKNFSNYEGADFAAIYGAPDKCISGADGPMAASLFDANAIHIIPSAKSYPGIQRSELKNCPLLIRRINANVSEDRLIGYEGNFNPSYGSPNIVQIIKNDQTDRTLACEKEAQPGAVPVCKFQMNPSEDEFYINFLYVDIWDGQKRKRGFFIARQDIPSSYLVKSGDKLTYVPFTDENTDMTAALNYGSTYLDGLPSYAIFHLFTTEISSSGKYGEVDSGQMYCLYDASGTATFQGGRELSGYFPSSLKPADPSGCGEFKIVLQNNGH